MGERRAVSGENEAGSAGLERVRLGADGRVLYPEPFKKYRESLGDGKWPSVRTIRDWVEIGKGSGKLPPLWSAAEMCDWWRDHKKHSVPQALLSAAMREGRTPELEIPTAARPASAADRPAAPIGRAELSLIDGGDASVGYQRAAQLETLAWSKLEEEYAKPEPDRSMIDYWTERHKHASLQRRQWEKDITGIREKQGDLLRRSELVAPLGDLANALARNFEKALRDLVIELAPEMSPRDRDAMVRQHRDECFRRLRDSEFAEVVKTEALAA